MSHHSAASTLPRPNNLGQVAVGHAALLIVFLSWRYGGMDPVGRQIAGWLLWLAPALTLAAWRECPARLRRRAAWIIIPLALLIAQVAVSVFNPSMRLATVWDAPVLQPVPHVTWLPSSMRPGLTWPDFAFMLGLGLVGFNLLLTRPSRAWLYGLLLTVVLNATLLAVVGTLFKLMGATTILGLTPSPNPSFFATFVYHNHWGAFVLLTAGAAMGLAWRAERRRTEAWSLSPVPFYLILAAALLVTLPLSTARGSTLVGAIFTAAMFLCWLRDGQRRGHAARPRLIGATLAAAAVITATAWLAAPSIRGELRVSREHWQAMRSGAIGEARAVIYADTLRLIQRQPVWGWGWNTFPHAYRQVQSPLPGPETRFKQAYVADAHSDWLEFVAEIGLIGLGTLLALAYGVARWAGRGAWRTSPAREIALALGALALLAVIDLPAANVAVFLTACVLAATAAELGRGTQHGSSPPFAKTTPAAP